MTRDDLEDFIQERAEKNPKFPDMVAAAEQKQKTAHELSLIDRRTTVAIILDRWIEGRVKIDFRPWPIQQDRDLKIAQKCAALFTKQTGKKNLLGSVRQNFEEIIPFLLEEIRKRTPTL